MAKQDYKKEREDSSEEMSLAEARAYRASLYKPESKVMSDADKREAFRLFWAQAKSKYGKSKDLEEQLWLHLKAMKMNDPEKFEDGLKHFGLLKVR